MRKSGLWFEMYLARDCCGMSHKMIKLELEEADVGQILDGLEVRRDAWRRTADYLESGDESGDDMFLIEECSDADEARWLAERYDAIIGKIHEQMKAQS